MPKALNLAALPAGQVYALASDVNQCTLRSRLYPRSLLFVVVIRQVFKT